MQSESTQQWHEEGTGVATGPAEIAMTNESAAEAPSQSQDMLTEPEQTLYVSPAYLTIGNFVDVAPRTWPGINQLGGVGCITKTHEVDVKRGNETAKKVVKINVKYTLGGRESNVDVCYVTEYVHGEKLRDRSKQLGRCTRCGSHREDCNSCDWVAEQQQQQEALIEEVAAVEHDDVSNTFMDSDEEERARLDISRKYKSLRRQRNKRRRKPKAVATTDKVQLDDEDIPLAVLEKQKEKQQKSKKPKQKRRRTAQTSVLASLPETDAAAKDETDEFEFPGTPTVGSPFCQEEERLLTPRPLDEDGNAVEEEKLLTPRPLDDDGNDIEEERLLTPRPLDDDETELLTPKTLNEDASMNFDGNDEISFHGDQDDSSDDDIALSTYEPESSDDSILSYESYETESDGETYDKNVVSQQLHQIPREFDDLLKFIDEVASEVSDNRLSYANQKLVLLKSRLTVAKNTRNTSLHAMNTAERVEIDLLAADR